jgi:hypothetical protein
MFSLVGLPIVHIYWFVPVGEGKDFWVEVGWGVFLGLNGVIIPLNCFFICGNFAVIFICKPKNRTMNWNYKNSDEFVKALKTDVNLQNAIKQDVPATMEKVQIEGELPNTAIYRLLVVALMITVLLIVAGVLVMALTGKAETNQNVLTIFTAIASTAIGALAGVLMPAQKKP